MNVIALLLNIIAFTDNNYATVTFDSSPCLDSPELRVIMECSPDLETALSVLERGFVHFLAQEGFITDEVSERVLDPQSMLSGEQSAGLLVKGIKRRVKLDSKSYHTLLEHFKKCGNLYQPIVGILEKAYSKLIKRQESQIIACGNQPHTEQGEHHKHHSQEDFNTLLVAYFSIQIRIHLLRWVESRSYVTGSDLKSSCKRGY